MNKRWRWSLVLIVMMACVLLSGCFRGEMKVDIHNNGSADVEYKMLAIPLAEKAVQEQFNRFTEMGFQAQRITEGESIGFKASRSIEAVEALNQFPLFSGGEGKPGIEVSRGWFYDDYTIRINSHMKQVHPDLYKDTDVNNPFWAQFSMKMIMTFPAKPESHNANSFFNDGKTLEWALSFSQDNHLEAKAKFWHMDHIVINLVVPVFVLGFLYSKRRKEAQAEGAASKISAIHPVIGGVVAFAIIAIVGIGFCASMQPKVPTLVSPPSQQQAAPAPAATNPAPVPAQVEETKAPINLKATELHGKWHGENEGISFDLYLHWDEGYYRGNHNITKKKPSLRTDGTTKNITITGQFTNVLPQTIAWSSMRGGKGTAEVTLIDKNTLRWKILTQQGEHYFPDEMILKR